MELKSISDHTQNVERIKACICQVLEPRQKKVWLKRRTPLLWCLQSSGDRIRSTDHKDFAYKLRLERIVKFIFSIEWIQKVTTITEPGFRQVARSQ